MIYTYLTSAAGTLLLAGITCFLVCLIRFLFVIDPFSRSARLTANGLIASTVFILLTIIGSIAATIG